MKKMKGFSLKALALMVAISVILSSVAISFAVIANADGGDLTAPPQIWQGDIAAEYAGGSGNSSDPFLIENAAQLAKLVHDSNTLGKYYRITEDIYINDVSLSNWKNTANQWFAYNKGAEFKDYYFKGTLDGDNHKIVGLYYNGDKYYFGLFAAVNGAVIENLVISQSSIASSNTGGSISAMTGYVNGPINYSKCIIDESVSISGAHASGYASYGSGNVTIDNCASFAQISGSMYTAAFIADIWSSTLRISNSIGIAKLSPKRSITSLNNYSTVSDTYGTNVVTVDNMKGEAAKTNMPNLNWQRVWATTEAGYPVIKVVTEDSAPGEVWTGRVAESYAGGDGSEASPFLISNGEQLAKLNFDTETEGKFYKLTHDIILNDSTLSNWKNFAINWVCDTANATFKGTLLGDGHTVYGLYYVGGAVRAALLKNTGGTVNISRVVLDGVHIQSSGFGSAGFVGGADGNLKLTECYVTNSSITSTYNTDGNKGAGGFVGYGTATVAVEDSAYLGTVSAPQFAGAFIGNCWTVGAQSVKNSFTNANLLFCSKRYINDTSVNNYAVFNDPAQWGVTLVADTQMKGTAARDNMPKLDWGRTWKVDTNGGYPLPVFPAPDGTVGEVWTGNTANSYAGGDGSEENPYLIATGEQLLKIAKSTDTEGKFYKIIADIKLNDTTATNWKDYARQWEWLDSTHSFKGTLDGDGHTISGLYYNGSKEKFGLFCYAANATIKRLIISNSSVTSTSFGTALLVGQASGTVKFVEVYADETNEVESTYSTTNDKSAGGFVGYGGATVIIEDSAYLGTVEGTAQYGAFLGNLWATPLIKNSFSSANLKLSGRWALSTDSQNNYGAGTVAENGVTLITANKMLGDAAKVNMPNLDWGRTWVVDTNGGYPLPLFPDPNGTPGEVWTGNTAVKFNGGDGTKDNPYQIATGEQLLKMVLDTASEGVYYKQTYDIKLNDASADGWQNTARSWLWNNNIFKGIFDGNGHTIEGLYYNGNKSKIGLFCYAKDATFKNIILRNSYIRSTGFATGTLIGDANGGKISISKCYVDNGYVESTYDTDGNKGAGGLVGYGGAAVTIDGSAFIGTVKAPEFAGAILGNCWSTITVKNSFSNAGIKFCTKQTLNKKSDNNYSTFSGTEACVISITGEKMKGASAKENMSGLDWKKVWKTSDSFPVLNFEDTVPTPADIWTGAIAESFQSGTGTEIDPYIIVNGEQLALMLETESADVFFKLGADIKLNDTINKDWIYGANQWLLSDKTFSGTLDGAGHSVEGLYYNGAKSSVGLIPRASNATVKNIVIKNPYIRTANYAVATVVGNAVSGEIKLEQCYVDNGYVESTFDGDGNRGAGGLVGYGSAAILVEDSAYLGKVKASGNAGAIIGNCWWPQKDGKPSEEYYLIVKNTFSNAGIKFCSKQAIHVKSDFNYSTCKDAEKYVFVIDEAKMKGKSAIDNMISLNWRNVWKTTDGFPVCRFGDVIAVGSNVWNGEIADKYASGTGTENDPYIIKNGGQLAFMVLDAETEGKYYELANDIILNSADAKNWQKLANQWIWTDNKFAGTLNGNGYTIEGLYYNGSVSKIGLICYADNAVITGIRFLNSYVKSTGYATGTVVGDANAGTVELYQCYVENGYVESTYNADNNKGAGGLIGYGGAKIKVTGSAFIGTVKAPLNAGAILGNCWAKDEKGASALVVSNTFSNAGIKFCTKQALSSLSDNNYINCESEEYGVISIKSDKMLGDAAAKNMPKLDWGNLWKTTSKYPICRFSDTVTVGIDVWSGKVASEYAGGDGTENNPYLISNGEELAKMVLDSNSEGKYYKQIKDIKLNDTSSKDWKVYARQWLWTNNVFKGHFDGDTKTITGLYYNGTKSKVGLFCYAANATIKRVVIDHSYIHSTGYATGTLVGDANKGTLDIIECYVTDNSSVESTFEADNNMGAGGLVGYGGAEIKVSGSAYLGSVTAPKFAGALLGNCWTAAVITNSFAAPELKFCSKRALAGDSASNYGTYVPVDDKDKENGVFSIKLSQMKGEAAKKNMPTLNWARSWKTTKNGFPVLNVGEYEGKKGQVWSGRLAKNYAGGSGTKNDPYLIATGEQLAKLVANVLESKGKYYKLVADIYLNDISKENWKENANDWFWVSTARKGNFNGHFNGDGHVIYGMYLNMDPTNDVIYTGLFPTISDGTVIEKTGLSDCHMTVKNTDVNKQAYVGGFAGAVFYNQSDEETDPNNLPVISQCFGDSKVIMEGRYAGGIVGGGARTANIYNSYFIGQVIGERVGAIIGNTWTTYEGTTISNCYSATNEADIFSGGRAGVQNSSTPIAFKDNYSNSPGLGGFVTQLGLLMMRGEAAKKNMTAFDFDNIWYAVEKGTPVLRVFGTTDKFSNTSEPKPIQISFVTNGGTECKPIYGNPEDKLTLPTTEREGYKFEGWYVYKELDMKYPVDYFPYFDQILYAKWTPLGIIQDFEDYTNTPYDYGDDYEYYRPGTNGYNADYVRSGMSAMHRIGAEGIEGDFLINYEDMLEIGTQYKISFWVNTDTDDTKADISIVHEDFPDVFDTDSGVEKITTLKGMKKGEWQEVVATFTAKSKWLAIRTSGNASIYFEDFMVIPTTDGSEVSGNSSTANYMLFIIIGAAAVLLASATVITVIFLKKRKANIK